jgi:hypothetical protein
MLLLHIINANFIKILMRMQSHFFKKKRTGNLLLYKICFFSIHAYMGILNPVYIVWCLYRVIDWKCLFLCRCTLQGHYQGHDQEIRVNRVCKLSFSPSYTYSKIIYF